jgi:hypothetical protein
MPDPKLITSWLSRLVEGNGDCVDVRIYRLEDTDRSLEIVASGGCARCHGGRATADATPYDH